MKTVPRTCKIIDGQVGKTPAADDDGAYDLLDVEGTPEEVGKAIADSLAEADLFGGGQGTYLERGQPIYINITIRLEPIPEAK